MVQKTDPVLTDFTCRLHNSQHKQAELRCSCSRRAANKVLTSFNTLKMMAGEALSRHWLLK